MATRTAPTAGVTPTTALLRRGLLALATLTTGAIALELITERHWTKPIMLVAWAAVALLAVAVALLLRAPAAWRVRVAQALAAVVIVSAVLGVWQHIAANHEAAPLDYRYAETWETLSAPTQWWLAARKAVGPSPPLASGVLAQAALLILLATLRHPALRATVDDRAE